MRITYFCQKRFSSSIWPYKQSVYRCILVHSPLYFFWNHDRVWSTRLMIELSRSLSQFCTLSVHWSDRSKYTSNLLVHIHNKQTSLAVLFSSNKRSSVRRSVRFFTQDNSHQTAFIVWCPSPWHRTFFNASDIASAIYSRHSPIVY